MKGSLGLTAVIMVLVIVFDAGCKSKKENTEGLETEISGVEYSLPSDVKQSCTLDSTLFNSWFESGTATENGRIQPANSVGLIHNDNCEFYLWSAQMFFWITSPDSAGGLVLESPSFYTVSPPNKKGSREFIPHVTGQPLRATSNISKDGLVDSEEEQATDDVLMAQNGSLIYYITFVNDVYAQFLTLAKQGKIQEAVQIYRWFLPLLELDIHPKLVQYIKLAEQLEGIGTEFVRAPRLTLVGEEREKITGIIQNAQKIRPVLS